MLRWSIFVGWVASPRTPSYPETIGYRVAFCYALLAATREAKVRIRSIETLPVSGRLEIYLTVPARMTSSAVRSLITSSLDQVVDPAQVQVKFR